MWMLRMPLTPYFYPRPPRGGRLSILSQKMAFQIFLSTPSARRATLLLPLKALRPCDFYPRPPRGGRRLPRAQLLPQWNFYPRPPRGGRQRQGEAWSANLIFLSTPSARRATRENLSLTSGPFYFYPRPPRGGRHRPARYFWRITHISIHALREEGDFASKVTARSEERRVGKECA